MKDSNVLSLLVQEWRKQADADYGRGDFASERRLRSCADKLEAALAEQANEWREDFVEPPPGNGRGLGIERLALAEQAQPEGSCTQCGKTKWGLGCTTSECSWVSRQAQPEMPTREQIATILCGFREDEAYPAADAVLALFAPKETA